MEVLPFVAPRNRHRLEVQPNWMVKPRIGKLLKGVDAQIAASWESLVESCGWSWRWQWTRAQLRWHSSPCSPSNDTSQVLQRWPRQAGSSLTIAGGLISYKVLILSCVFINQTINVHSTRIRQRVWSFFFFCANTIYFYININFCKLSFVLLAPLLLLAVVDSSAANAFNLSQICI